MGVYDIGSLNNRGLFMFNLFFAVTLLIILVGFFAIKLIRITIKEHQIKKWKHSKEGILFRMQHCLSQRQFYKLKSELTELEASELKHP